MVAISGFVKGRSKNQDFFVTLGYMAQGSLLALRKTGKEEEDNNFDYDDKDEGGRGRKNCSKKREGEGGRARKERRKNGKAIEEWMGGKRRRRETREKRLRYWRSGYQVSMLASWICCPYFTEQVTSRAPVARHS